MKILIIHPHGNQNTSKTVKTLYKTNLLDTFWTTIAFPKKLNFLRKKIYNVDYKYIKIRFLKNYQKICVLFKLKKFYSKDSNFFHKFCHKDLDLKVSRYLETKKK